MITDADSIQLVLEICDLQVCALHVSLILLFEVFDDYLALESGRVRRQFYSQWWRDRLRSRRIGIELGKRGKCAADGVIDLIGIVPAEGRGVSVRHERFSADSESRGVRCFLSDRSTHIMSRNIDKEERRRKEKGWRSSFLTRAPITLKP